MDPKLQLTLIIESGLMGILGGVISALVVSILTRRKNEAEIKKLQAETKKLLHENDNSVNAPRREIMKVLREKMIVATSRIKGLVPAYVVHTDLNILPSDTLDEFLNGSFLTDYEKRKLITAQDKNTYYQRVLSQHNWQSAEEAVRDFHNYLVFNSYTISENIASLCKELDTILSHATEGTKFQQAAGIDVKLSEIDVLYREKILPTQEKIEMLIKEEVNPT